MKNINFLNRNICYFLTTFPNGTSKITLYKSDKKFTPIYQFEGIFKISIIDENTIVLIEAQKSDFKLNSIDKEHKAITFIGLINESTYVETFEIPKNYTAILDDGLSNIKKIILPLNGKFIVYSYEFGIIVSAEYDTIYYDKEINQFYVTYNLFIDGKLVILHGELDCEGHLINNILYSPELDAIFDVDEHNLKESISKITPQIKRSLVKQEKRKKQIQNNEFEYELYCQRKRSKK